MRRGRSRGDDVELVGVQPVGTAGHLAIEERERRIRTASALPGKRVLEDGLQRDVLRDPPRRLELPSPTAPALRDVRPNRDLLERRQRSGSRKITRPRGRTLRTDSHWHDERDHAGSGQQDVSAKCCRRDDVVRHLVLKASRLSIGEGRHVLLYSWLYLLHL